MGGATSQGVMAKGDVVEGNISWGDNKTGAGSNNRRH